MQHTKGCKDRERDMTQVNTQDENEVRNAGSDINLHSKYSFMEVKTTDGEIRQIRLYGR